MISTGSGDGAGTAKVSHEQARTVQQIQAVRVSIPWALALNQVVVEVVKNLLIEFAELDTLLACPINQVFRMPI